MSFVVSKVSEEQVVPYEATPSLTLPLSWLDRYPTQRALIGSLHVFDQGPQRADCIKWGLAKALVPYYPLAGRLVESEMGELQVACTGEGVCFVEASAGCSLVDVNHLEHPFLMSTDELVPHLYTDDEESLLFMMQVTIFKCGGFIVGIRSSHAIFDGVGACQFVTAISELARGLTKPTTDPIWCRESIPTPPKFCTGSLPTPTTSHLQYMVLNISADHIKHMKERYSTLTAGETCSTFDVLVAKAWQCRTQTIGLDPDDDVHLNFAMDTRPLLKQVMHTVAGYYGNSYYIMKVTAKNGRIAGASLVEIVKMIRNAKNRFAMEYSKFVRGEAEEDPYQLTSAYDTMLVSDWRLGFNDVNYGWGAPVHIVPITTCDIMSTCILVKPPASKWGARLVTQCVTREHFAEFLDRMMS